MTPFTSRTDLTWIPTYVDHRRHTFDHVVSPYVHDRSRAYASLRDWYDYFKQAYDGVRSGCRSSEPVGFMTAFPQLAVAVGIWTYVFRCRAPIIAWYFNLSHPYSGLKGALARFALRRVDLFVVHSTPEIESYATWLGVDRSKFLYVPLSIEFFEPEASEREDEPFVLAMGTANRDYASLVEALKRLGYPAVIVSGSSAVDEIDFPPNVVLKQGLTLKQCHRLCQEARVNVIPLKDQDAPSGQVTMLETMMFGKAIVMTDCSGGKDYMTDRQNGILVPPKDVETMVAAIEELWDSATERARLGSNARAYVCENATFQRAAVPMTAALDALEALMPSRPSLS